MSTIGFDYKTGKMISEHHSFLLSNGHEEIILSLKQSMYTYLGEWAWNREYGMDFHRIKSNLNSFSIIDMEIKRVIENSYGVLSVLKYTGKLNKSSRIYHIEVRLRTTMGIIDEELYLEI